jgi:hypothetical protein
MRRARRICGAFEQDWEPTVSIDLEYYRSKLRLMFGTDVKSAVKSLHPLIDEETVRRLISENYSQPFGKLTSERLKWYIDGGEERRTYYNLLNRMGQKTDKIKSLSDYWVGEYNYFRFFANSDRPNDITYNRGEGRISIEYGNKIIKFKHWSHNHKSEIPEHEGYVLKSENHIFMLGAANGRMRLAVAQNVVNPKKEKTVGIVLSQRNDYPYSAFSARFIMVSSHNKELIEKYSDIRAAEDPKYKTAGEMNFHTDVGGGDYSYFMLDSH